MTSFGQSPDGHEARLYTLENSNGFRAEITDYGGIIVRLFARDRKGRLGDVVLGFDTLAGYVAQSPYFGCIIGRVGNRIANGQFTLNGQTYTLAKNNRPGGIPCHLHGGMRGFDKVWWDAEPFTNADGGGLRLRYQSKDGEEGYPGNLDVSVTYLVTGDDALRIDYEAQTDRATPVNLTNHSYFNLAGEGAPPVLGHALTLNASAYTPVNAGLIPRGEITPVENTPFDFRAPHTIGDRIDRPHEQLRFAGGYDHNFALDARDGAPAIAATVLEPQSGRLLEVLTTEPGVQFYSGNFLTGMLAGKNGHVYPRRGGFCLETQHFPDSPNQPDFPPVILQPGATLHSTTVYRFSTR
ncbi:MAG: aldose epimerase family protein [Opitutaceae bacterium]|nr:aldose epimerase family protein [Opitutaceae bacterium]